MSQSSVRPIKRVMLIFPPMYDVKVLDTMVCPPMGIAYLAAYIRDTVEVSLLDCVAEAYQQKEPITDEVERVGLTDDEILERIKTWEPDLVGLSCIFSNQIGCVDRLSRRVKREIGQDVLIVTGGTHPSFLPEKTLLDTDVDVVVLGEGELGLHDIIQARNQGQGLETVDGIAYRDNGEIIVHPRTTWIEDLDTLPFPARDLLPLEKYFQAKIPMAFHWRKIRNMPIISSRGCPNRCSFCSSWRHWGQRFRKRSAENVLAEIKHLKEDFGIEELKWQDDNLTADKERAMEIFSKMIERGLAMPWNTPNGIAIWTLNEEMIRLMKKSGCFEISLAVESGDPESFERYVGKPFPLEKAREVARLARKYRIATVGYFIIGFPGETFPQIQRSMRFALELGVDYLSPFIYIPIPGSKLWEECLSTGLISEEYAYEESNNFFERNFNSELFDINKLYRLQAKSYIINLIKLPFRNPREFVAWYGRRLRHHPEFLKDFFDHTWRYRGKITFKKTPPEKS